MKKIVRRIKLAVMPFDKWDGQSHIHATGYEVMYSGDDSFSIEYEDDLEWSEDAPNCKYYWEDEDGNILPE